MAIESYASVHLSSLLMVDVDLVCDTGQIGFEANFHHLISFVLCYFMLCLFASTNIRRVCLLSKFLAWFHNVYSI